MKAVVLLLFIVAVSCHRSLWNRDKQFDDFLTKYGKNYEGAEYLKRLHVFRENLKLAEQRNQIGGATHGITKFMDLTEEEFASQMLMPPQAPTHLAEACLRKGVYAPHLDAPIDTPAALDWRKTPNVVLAVQDQGSCGSCWAFSTTQSIEGQNGMQGTPDAGTMLSAQYIVDCSKGCSSEIYDGENTTVCNGGCNGGWPWTAFDDLAITQSTSSPWIVPDAASYPYKGITMTCKQNTGKTASKVYSYQCIGLDATDNEDEIASYLATLGPLSIALNANPFQTYTGGIIEPALCSTKALNHAVLLVGYDTDAATNTPYWIVKNSWGASWGESGYCRILRGKGTCGINEAVSCPSVVKA